MPDLYIHENPNWTELVQQIIDGDAAGVQALYYAISPIRNLFRHNLGPDVAQDRYHDLIVALVNQIRDGNLREPQRLIGYARAIAIRQIMTTRKSFALQRNFFVSADDVLLVERRPNPETMAVQHERRQLAQRILSELSSRDREVLVRFYFGHETAASIQAHMALTSTQFRLIKWRAKARFSEYCQARLTCRRSVSVERVRPSRVTTIALAS